MSYETREQYLNAAVNLVRLHLQSTANVFVPKDTKVSCGLAGGRIGAKRIGECWSVQCSPDGSTQIFISPEISNPSQVLATLVHECVHAAVGVDKKHGKVFRDAALAGGLVGKMTATIAGDELQAKISTWMGVLGAYPHAGLVASMRKKQKTRLVKCQCGECGYTVRTTAKWIDKAGAPLCPCNSEPMNTGSSEETDE